MSILGANPEVIPGPTGSTQCIFKNIWIWWYLPLMWQFLLQVEVNLGKKDELSIAGQGNWVLHVSVRLTLLHINSEEASLFYFFKVFNGL